MSSIRFNHVFAALMLISGLSAFVIPEKYVVRAQPQVQSLFVPVAAPARAAAGWIHGRLAPPAPADTRDARTLAAENDELRQQNAGLVHELAALRRINDDREDVGKWRHACTPIKVLGADPAVRDGLLLRGSTADGLRQGQPVLYGNSVAGKIERAPGLLGAQARLVTDPGMRVGAYFGRFTSDKTGKPRWRRLTTSAALVEGIGNGAMRCATDLTMQEVKATGLRPGDWVVVEDIEWDERVHGRQLGRVARVAPQNAAPLYADIRIEPTKNLMLLREVMVLTE